MHVGAAQVERGGDVRHRRIGDMAELGLDGVQQRQQRAPLPPERARDRIDLPGHRRIPVGRRLDGGTLSLAHLATNVRAIIDVK